MYPILFAFSRVWRKCLTADLRVQGTKTQNAPSNGKNRSNKNRYNAIGQTTNLDAWQLGQIAPSLPQAQIETTPERRSLSPPSSRVKQHWSLVSERLKVNADFNQDSHPVCQVIYRILIHFLNMTLKNISIGHAFKLIYCDRTIETYFWNFPWALRGRILTKESDFRIRFWM